MSELENYKQQMNTVADLIRAHLRGKGEGVAKQGGLAPDLLKAMSTRGYRIEEILPLLPGVPTELKATVAKKAALIRDTAENELNLTSILSNNLVPSIGTAALRVGYEQLVAWRHWTLEQRLLAVLEYLRFVDIEYGYDDWCAAFVSWCLEQVPAAMWGDIERKRSSGALRLLKKFTPDAERYGLFHDGATPKPGDIVFWWREKNDDNLGHVGFVMDVSATRVVTLEGNVDTSITLREYRPDQANPFYKGASHGFLRVLRLPEI